MSNKINVPFVFEAKIVKPRCRNYTIVSIADNIEIEVKNFNNLPVGLRLKDTDYLWCGQNLWTAKEVEQSNSDKNTITFNELKTNIENKSRNYNNFNPVERYSFVDYGNAYDSKDEAIKDNKSYLEDNREEIIKEIEDIFNKLMFNENRTIFEITAEPIYQRNTFGLGGNHGGTSLGVANYFNGNISYRSYYSALEYDLAVSDTIECAKNRGDDRSIERIKNCTKIEVLIPESVKIDIRYYIKEFEIEFSLSDLLKTNEKDFKELITKTYIEEFKRDIVIEEFEIVNSRNSYKNLLTVSILKYS